MHILINGAACGGWGRREDGDVRFSKSLGPNEGRVLSREEAMAAAEASSQSQRERLFLWTPILFGIAVVIAAIAGDRADGGSPALGLLVAMLVAALFVGVNLWSLGARAKERRARHDGGGGRLPPAGASVMFDETAFRLDDATIPWASLTAERLVVIETGGEDTTDYHVERIEANDGNHTQLFDRYLYSNGEALVRMAYLKLIRERLPVAKR
jgi:hypothetical protein